MTDTLELERKACEVLGITAQITWRASRDGGKSVAMEFEQEAHCHAWCAVHYDYETIRWEKFPRLASNNGLALDALVKWCNASDYRWKIATTSTDFEVCIMTSNYTPFVTEDGETPAIAICKALIASAESIRKAGE